MKKIQVLSLIIEISVLSASAQSSFQNLDFESANLSPIPQGQYGGYVPIGAGLPGWTGLLGSQQTTQVLQNNLTAGTASIDIWGPHWPASGVIDGNYTAELQAGEYNGIVAATIEQSGLVPSGTKSIQMKLGTGATGFAVSLGGAQITMVPLATSANYTIYGGNVSSLAGQTAQLSISALPLSGDQFNSFSLDSIIFSQNAVPEPATLTLLLCGAALFGIMRKLRP